MKLHEFVGMWLIYMLHGHGFWMKALRVSICQVWRIPPILEDEKDSSEVLFHSRPFRSAQQCRSPN